MAGMRRRFRVVLPRLAAFSALAAVAVAVGAELVARQLTPPWPAVAMRPVPISAAELVQWQSGMPQAAFSTNSWQMRDRERSVAKPPGISRRYLFVGDSVLDGTFTRAAIPARVEARFVAAGHDDFEAVNLGVTSTSPIEYYYRLRDVGLRLKPDAAVMMFFSGNDFLYRSFADEPRLPPFVDELPRPSLLGAVAPHATWLIAGALRPAPAPADPAEQQAVNAALARPLAEGAPVLAELMQRRYFPRLERKVVEEIVGRGGERFWSAFGPRLVDREFLPVAILRQMIALETGAANVVPAASPEVEAALSWLAASARLAKTHHLPFTVALAPVATVDPDFADFWQPWPHYNLYNRLRDGHHKALAAALARAGIPHVDLRQDLLGVRDAFRKTDMHWTERGSEIVAARLAAEALDPKTLAVR